MGARPLPNDARTPTTESVAFFAVDGTTFVDWLLSELSLDGTVWTQRALVGPGPERILSSLSTLVDVGVSRYLVLSHEGWTAILNNGKLGTDVGMIPSVVARRLGCRAIRAVTVPNIAPNYGATILEIFDSGGEAPLSLRRVICAANDAGTWRFSQSGRPFPFEQTDAYQSRRIRDRFTPDLLHSYLASLGVPTFTLNELSAYSPLLVERR